MFDKIAEFRKAIAAFLVPALTVLGGAALPDTDGVVRITLNEWIAVAIAALGTSIIVGAVPNAVTDAQVRASAKHLEEPAAVAASLVSEENRRRRA